LKKSNNKQYINEHLDTRSKLHMNQHDIQKPIIVEMNLTMVEKLFVFPQAHDMISNSKFPWSVKSSKAFAAISPA
jgi:hypothetical protein